MERKLSKIGWLIVICCIVLVGSLAYADTKTETNLEDELRALIFNFKPDSEPDGFRGIKWGARHIYGRRVDFPFYRPLLRWGCPLYERRGRTEDGGSGTGVNFIRFLAGQVL